VDPCGYVHLEVLCGVGWRFPVWRFRRRRRLAGNSVYSWRRAPTPATYGSRCCCAPARLCGSSAKPLRHLSRFFHSHGRGQRPFPGSCRRTGPARSHRSTVRFPLPAGDEHGTVPGGGPVVLEFPAIARKIRARPSTPSRICGDRETFRADLDVGAPGILYRPPTP